MQSGYYPPIEFNNCVPHNYERYNFNPSEYNMPQGYSGHGPFDKIVEYRCIEPGCGIKHGITLQDFTVGCISDQGIEYLIELNTRFRCPIHEPMMARSNILVQWGIPHSTMFSESVKLAAKYRTHILCPEKGCGLLFKTPSEFKRHLAAIFRPFYCLRGNCCIEGVPCRKGFGRIEEVINHLKNENSQHHDPVRYRPVEGWDFRRKNEEEIDEVLKTIKYIPEEEFYGYYCPPQPSYY